MFEESLADWGGDPIRLVKMIEGLEAQAGFDPPLWVDIRHSRNVRAPGFRGNAFGELLGRDRYVWIQELGNGAIGSDKCAPIKINHPEAAGRLLNLGLEKAQENRRLLFFCACHFPYFAPIDCHRALVADLLICEARRADVSIEVVEWPGGNPTHLKAEIDEPLFRAIEKGKNLVPFDSLTPAAPRVLPYCSILELYTSARNYSLLVLTGPASYYKKDWMFHVLALWSTADDRVSAKEVLEVAGAYRKELGFDALHYEPASGQDYLLI